MRAGAGAVAGPDLPAAEQYLHAPAGGQFHRDRSGTGEHAASECGRQGARHFQRGGADIDDDGLVGLDQGGGQGRDGALAGDVAGAPGGKAALTRPAGRAGRAAVHALKQPSSCSPRRSRRIVSSDTANWRERSSAETAARSRISARIAIRAASGADTFPRFPAGPGRVAAGYSCPLLTDLEPLLWVCQDLGMAIPPPSSDDLARIARQYGFALSPGDLESFRGLVTGALGSYRWCSGSTPNVCRNRLTGSTRGRTRRTTNSAPGTSPLRSRAPATAR